MKYCLIYYIRTNIKSTVILKMKEKKRWSATEDSIVVDQVRKSPTNLKHAFREAARVTGRSEHACRIRWYTILSKDKKNVCFIIKISKQKTLNRKNRKGTACTQNLFTKILKLLGIIK